MSYIGVEPTGGTFDKQVITGDGSNTTFNLDFPVKAQLMVSLRVYYKNQTLHLMFH